MWRESTFAGGRLVGISVSQEIVRGLNCANICRYLNFGLDNRCRFFNDGSKNNYRCFTLCEDFLSC